MVSNLLTAFVTISERRSVRAPFLLVFAVSSDLLSGEPKLVESTRPAMGTQFRIACHAEPDSAAVAIDLAFARVAELERVLSDYNPGSEVARLNQSTSPFIASPDLFECLERSMDIAQKTDGAFDFTLGHYTQLWRRSRRKVLLPDAALIESRRQQTGYAWVQLDPASHAVTFKRPGMMLDFGGIGKGFAADAALKVLKQNGIESAIVAGSGDYAIGSPPPGELGWTITLRAFKGDCCTLKLSNCGVSTSGDLNQFVDIGGIRYSHIVDPQTGLGLTTFTAASVIAHDATSSDALATAICVMESTKAMTWQKSFDTIQLRIASKNGGSVQIQTTTNWPRK